MFDPNRGHFLIPCADDRSLDVVAIDGHRRVSVTRTLRTMDGARTGAFDPVRRRAYFPGVTFGSATMMLYGHKVPKPLDRSGRILELSVGD